jgi:hypothetical protein
MNRLFSMIRRRPNHIDIVTPFTYGVDGYRLKWASNFDAGSFTTIITASNIGYVDPSINPNVIAAMPMGGVASTGGRNIRIVFNPATFSIPDASSFWLQFAQVTGGSETLLGAPTLVLPDAAHRGVGIVTIAGNAPAVANSSSALQIDLPGLMEEIRIHNASVAPSAVNLYVSTEQGGAETQLQPDTFSQFTSIRGTQGSIWVRNDGSQPSPFSATCTRAFPR